LSWTFLNFASAASRTYGDGSAVHCQPANTRLQAHRESVNVALDELERYVQARIGGNNPPETTGKWVAAKFEHDSSRPVDGYAAPQLHTHAVFFNITERDNGETRALQPHELYRSHRYGTAIYRAELSVRLKELGYQIEPSATGAPEITGYSQEYMAASSPRRQQIQEHLKREGFDSLEALKSSPIAPATQS
jgi:conjugative relaxase-like TrwC/TraI family protein